MQILDIQAFLWAIYVQRYTGDRSLGERVLVWSDQWSWISIIHSHRCFQLGCLLSIQFVVMQLVLLVYFFFFFLPLYLLLYTSVICLKWSFNLFIRYGWSKLIIAFLTNSTMFMAWDFVFQDFFIIMFIFLLLVSI